MSTAVTPDGDVTPFELPGGRVVTGMHVGCYESLEAPPTGNSRSGRRPSGHPLAGHMWESYLTDPKAQPDPATWQTRITWPLA